MKRSMEPSWRVWGAVCILLVLLTGGATPSGAYQQDLKKMAAELAVRVHAMKHSRVTVIDFVDLDSKPTRLGKFLAQQLQASLAEPELDLVVVDQSQLSQLMDQVELLNEGLLDPATGRALGQIAGTEVIVLGTVMSSSMTVRVDIKAIDLQTAKVIAGKSASVARLGIVEKLAKEAAGEDEEEVAEAEDEQKVAQAKKSAPQGPARSRRDLGVIFDLDGCSLNADILTCEVTVTSTDKDRFFNLGFNSRAWTEAGAEYEPSEIAIANSTFKDRNCVVKKMLRNVPTRTILTFPDFGEDAGLVERLGLYWGEDDRGCYPDWRPVNFEKIEISGEIQSASSKKTSPLGIKQQYGSGGSGKKSGGILQRIGSRVLSAVEEAAAEVIDKQTRKLVGDDEEEEEDPKKKN